MTAPPPDDREVAHFEEMITMADTRPNPLGEAAAKVGAVWSAIAGIVGALTAFGVLTVAQGAAIGAAGSAAPDIITALGTLIAGVMPLVGGLLAAFRTASAGREHVTPVADPRDNLGRQLVPVSDRVGKHAPIDHDPYGEVGP